MYLLQSYNIREHKVLAPPYCIYMRDIYLYEIKAMYFEKLRNKEYFLLQTDVVFIVVYIC